MSKQTSEPKAKLRQKRKFWQTHIKAWNDSNLRVRPSTAAGRV